MKQRTLAAAAALLCVLLLFAACGAQTQTEAPVTVNGTPIDAEIFRYFLDETFNDSIQADRNARVDAATQACIRYTAVNTAFAGMGLSLTPGERVQVSEEANALWNIFGEHYRAIGVSKETFVKLRAAAACREKLRNAMYGENGTQPISDDTLKAYFAEHYVCVRYLDGYLYTTDANGQRKGFSETTLTDIRTRFEQAAAQINAGGAMEPILVSLSGSIGIDMRSRTTTEVLDADADGFPNGFFDAVRGMETGKAGVILLDGHIYLVHREDPAADETLFKKNRDACLRAVSEAPLQTEIGKLCEDFSSVRKTRLAQACFTEVLEGRNKD